MVTILERKFDAPFLFTRIIYSNSLSLSGGLNLVCPIIYLMIMFQLLYITQSFIQCSHEMQIQNNH